jgi:hypothetical protein
MKTLKARELRGVGGGVRLMVKVETIRVLSDVGLHPDVYRADPGKPRLKDPHEPRLNDPMKPRLNDWAKPVVSNSTSSKPGWFND